MPTPFESTINGQSRGFGGVAGIKRDREDTHTRRRVGAITLGLHKTTNVLAVIVLFSFYP